MMTGFALLDTPAAALAAAYGAAGAVSVSMLLAHGIKTLDRRLEQNKDTGVSAALPGTALRLSLVLLFFWFGISTLKLAPLPMVATFSLLQLGYFFNFLKLKS